MEYIKLEKDFFSPFISMDFEQFISENLNNGTWGDDVQIQVKQI